MVEASVFVIWFLTTCPGCSSHEEPVRNNDRRTRALNRYRCTECGQIGSVEEFKPFPVLEGE